MKSGNFRVIWCPMRRIWDQEAALEAIKSWRHDEHVDDAQLARLVMVALNKKRPETVKVNKRISQYREQRLRREGASVLLLTLRYVAEGCVALED